MKRSELPMLSNGAGLCGGGEAVTGPLCVAVAIGIFVIAEVWAA